MRLRHFLALGLVAAACCAGFGAPPLSGATQPPPIVRPGFYSVHGEASCRARFGPVVFLPSRPRSLVAAGGLEQPVMLHRQDEDRYAIDGTGCALRFENNDLRTVGICTRLISHRGDARTFPANTLPAFQDAMLQGFAGFELDVRLSANNVAIVSHDENLAAATDCRGRVSGTDSAAIGLCRAVRSPLLPERRFLASRAKLAAPVPTLREALARFLPDPRVRQIVVDIKDFPDLRAMIAALAAALPGCPGPQCQAVQRRLTFISQDRAHIGLLRDAFADSHVALESNRTVSGLIDEPGDHWAGHGYDTFSLSYGSVVDPRLWLVKLIRGQNLRPARRFHRFYERNRGNPRRRRLLGWTLNNSAGIRGLRRYAFADVLTDLPYSVFVRKLMEGGDASRLDENVDRLARGGSIGCERDVAGEG